MRTNGKLGSPSELKEACENLVIQESGNLSKTWSSGIEVSRGRASYSQLVDVGGKIGLLYESDKGHITFKVVV